MLQRKRTKPRKAPRHGPKFSGEVSADAYHYRKCIRKRRFEHLKQAVRVAEKRGPQHGIDLYVYDCSLCKGFHLTRARFNGSGYANHVGYCQQPGGGGIPARIPAGDALLDLDRPQPG